MNQVQNGNSPDSARVSRVGCGVSSQRSCPFREALGEIVALEKVRDGEDATLRPVATPVPQDACAPQSSETIITAIVFIR